MSEKKSATRRFFDGEPVRDFEILDAASKYLLASPEVDAAVLLMEMTYDAMRVSK